MSVSIANLVCEGNISALEDHLSRNPTTIGEVDDKGYTALHWAAYFDEKEIAELVLSKRSELSIAENARGNHPLHLAAQQNSLRVLQVIIDRAAPCLNHQNHWGETPLHLACQGKNFAVIERLLSVGADVAVRDSWGRSPADVAIENGENEVAQLVDPRGLTVRGPTPTQTQKLEDLSAKISSGIITSEFMEKLRLKRESGGGEDDEHAVTVQHFFSSHTESVSSVPLPPPPTTLTSPSVVTTASLPSASSLPKKRISISQRVEYPGDKEALESMLRDPEKYDPAAKDFFGLAAIHKFSSWDKVDLLDLLLTSAQPPLTTEQVNELGGGGTDRRTALHCAVDMQAGRALLRLLQDSRLQPNTTDSKGRTALEFAIELGSPAHIVETLSQPL